MLSDKMEFSITLWNIWSVLPLPAKSTATFCSVGKHFMLRFPHAAGRNRCQELQTWQQSSHSHQHHPPLSHGGDAGGGSIARHRCTLHLLSGNQGFLQCWTLSQGYTRTWRKSTPYCCEGTQDLPPSSNRLLQPTQNITEIQQPLENLPLSKKSSWKFSWGHN